MCSQATKCRSTVWACPQPGGYIGCVRCIPQRPRARGVPISTHQSYRALLAANTKVSKSMEELTVRRWLAPQASKEDYALASYQDFFFESSFKEEGSCTELVSAVYCKTDLYKCMNRFKLHDIFNKMGLNSSSGGVSPSQVLPLPTSFKFVIVLLTAAALSLCADKREELS